MMRGPGGHRGPGRGGPMAAAMGKAEKAADFSGTIKRLIRYMGIYKYVFIFVFFISILSTAGVIFGPKILGNATNKLFEGIQAQVQGTGSIDFNYILNIVYLTVALYIGSALLTYIAAWIMANVSTNITYRMRKDVSEKINRMPLKYFDKTTQGEVLSWITNDIDTINQTLSQSLTQIITSIVTVIGVLIMMLSINWILTLAALITIPLTVLTMGTIIKASQKYFVDQQDYLGHVNGHVEENFGGHTIVKAFNQEEESIETFDVLNDELYKAGWKSQFLSGLMMPIMIFIGNLGYVVVAIVGSWLVIAGDILIGDVQAFIQYVRSFTQPLSQIATMANVLQRTAAAAERVFLFLDEEEQVKETPTPIKLLESVEGHVELKNVRFGYNPETIVIKNFSMSINPGQKVAIVGPTGAGKTTIVKLLMRFYELNSGSILIDGHDSHDFTRADLRKMFGMVLQDTWLYNASIMENIRYSKPDATDEEVIEAAKMAHVDSFIHTLPGGYNMVLNEETSNISQGQMQLITIARAILANPRILILDEATSSVDTRTELLIQKAMDKLMKDRTSFIIAHRLSTIRNADLILVMREGDVVEKGTHKELLAQNGFYSEIYHSQFHKGGSVQGIATV